MSGQQATEYQRLATREGAAGPLVPTRATNIDQVASPLSPSPSNPIIVITEPVPTPVPTPVTSPAPSLAPTVVPRPTPVFATRGDLARWFPQIDYDEKQSWRIWLSRRSRALMLQITIIGVIFIVNIGLTAFAASRYDARAGVGLIYGGNCDTVQQLDQWLHLLINLLSTGMLGASNYCMQLQAAPTRADVDTAHRENQWLDIGIPSFRNLRYISGLRRFTWFVLALSSLPVHLVYNSAVFQSLSSNDYTVAVVKNSFLDGNAFDLATAEQNRRGDPGWDEKRVNPPNNYTQIILDMQTDAMNRKYETLNLSACFDLYNDYFAPQGNVIIFVKNQSAQVPSNNSLLMYVSVVPRLDSWAKNMWGLANGTRTFKAVSPPSPVLSWYLGPPKYEVSHCLIQKPGPQDQRCRFQYSLYIMITICVMNFIKFVTMVFVWVSRRWQEKAERDTQDKGESLRAPKDQVLYTLGDAIASFMREPDATTQNMCLATKDDFGHRRTMKGKLRKEPPNPTQEPRTWKYEPHFWMESASRKRWIILISVCCIVICVTGLMFERSMYSLRNRSMPRLIPDLWGLGFGALTPLTYINVNLPRADPAGLITNVLVANLPQLTLSVVYIFYNAMLSTFLVQRQWSLMHAESKRKPLRVSEPIGIQRSSYFISLPFRYGIPLYATSGIMHWLISQSLFIARITALRNTDGEVDYENSYSTCGFSPIAIFTTMLVEISLVLALVVISFRRYDGTMRLVSTNSCAISAACHVPEEDRRDGYLLPVKWSVVAINDDGVGHCAFSTAPKSTVGEPVASEEMKYA